MPEKVPQVSPCIVIPARKGSKRLPGKNMRPIGSYDSLVRRALEVATLSRVHKDLDGLIVITSDIEPLRSLEDKDQSILYVDRPESLRGDDIPMVDVLQDVASRFEDSDPFILLQPTAPLTAPGMVDALMRIYQNTDVRSVFTVHPATLKASGNVYLVDREGLLEGTLYPEPSAIVAVPAERCIDIDDESDFVTAAALMKGTVYTWGTGDRPSLNVEQEDDEEVEEESDGKPGE